MRQLNENEEIVEFSQWKFIIQKDRSNIFEGFEEGDLPNLFDESNVVQYIHRKPVQLRHKQFKHKKEKKGAPHELEEEKMEPKNENEEVVHVGQWKFRIQKDRS